MAQSGWRNRRGGPRQGRDFEGVSQVDACFNVFDVLRIAEEVEHKAARFYLQAAERFADREHRSIYYDLASWRARHERAWTRIRREHSEKTGQFGTFDPDDYVVSNPQVMAGLTSFGTEANSLGHPTGHETRAQVVRDTIRRSEGVVIFYGGLKEFASDPASQGTIDNMIAEETRHIRLLNRLLDRMRKSSAAATRSASWPGDGGRARHAQADWHVVGHN
jgi:rubrerythrin